VAIDQPPTEPKRNVWQRRVLDPVVAQITQGITPEKIALTIAVGSALALFPMLGVTTFFCIIAGIVLRLNQPIIQVVNYLCTPIHLPLIFYFWHLGEKLFGVPHVRMKMREAAVQMWDLLWQHPTVFFNRFGLLVFHAAVVWALLAPIWIAMIYYSSRTLLREIARVRAQAAAKLAASKLADPTNHPVP
jgi:uncharacterized protein (DUF2062 family)